MQDYIIDVTQIEEFQTISDLVSLDTIFARAKRTLVNGAKVLLVRKQEEISQKFDEFTTLEELETYKNSVYKYL
ncbi:MAG TPA: hypothetical protein VFQ73_03020 [Flavisolibacter sp.]|nr:hypothetical protein [Flavisolibacter sp.]